MSNVLQRHVGILELLDLEGIWSYLGRDYLPYPFMFTRPTRLATYDAARGYANTVPDRFNYGDLLVFKECVDAYHRAEIRAECHVQHIPADTPSLRVMAYRAGHLGFFMAQRPDADVVDVYTVSPYDLGAAICEATSLTQPGGHHEIAVPEYARTPQSEYDTETIVVHHQLAALTEVTIPASEVTAYGRVQSHWRAARRWGFDYTKQAVVWVRINGDGEYIYVPDGSHATPMNRTDLHRRIDELIAEDIVLRREFRDDSGVG